MSDDERQLLLTVAWMFVRHGQVRRARTILECVVEETPSDGIAAAVLADLMLRDGEALSALKALRAAMFPAPLQRAAAMLETRALKMLGKADEAEARWRRYANAARGIRREWVVGG